MPFLEVKNFKDALIQELVALQWDAYGELPQPEKTSTNDWEWYVKYKYYKSIRDGRLIGPVLIPNDTCKNWFSRMYGALGGDVDTARMDLAWRPVNELVNWSGTEKLLGEIENGGVISVNNLFKYKLNENWQRTSGLEPRIQINTLDIGTGQISVDSSATNVAKFKTITSGQIGGIFVKDIPREEFLETMEKYGTYKTSDGKEEKSDFIAFRQVSDDYDGLFWTGTVEDNRDYIYRNQNPPRIQVTNRDYTMYIKFKCVDGGVTFYRYIPIFPFLYYDQTTTTPRFIGDVYHIGYESDQLPPFAFQPFNMYEPKLAVNQIYGLPPVLWNGANQIRYYQAVPYTSYNYPTMFVAQKDIEQFMYLTGVRFITTDTQSGELTPYYDLSQGSDSYSTDTGIEDDEESGTTSQPGGTVTPGNRDEEQIVTPSQGYTFKVPGQLLEPGFYGGLYIPTYRYFKRVPIDVDEKNKTVEGFTELIRQLEKVGKGGSLVEAFFHYSGFITQNSTVLKYLSVFVDRPTYLCGYDKNSEDAYVPINNKLFIYPYCSMELNGYGQINELRFENFSQNRPELRIVSKLQPGATIFIYPVDYGGVKNNYDGGVAGQPLAILPYTKNDFLNEYHATQNARSQAIQNINDIHSAQQLQTVVNGITQGLGAVGGALQLGGIGAVNTRGLIGMGLSAGAGVLGSIGNTATSMLSANVQKNAQLAAYEAEFKDIENRPLAVANQNAAPSLPELINSNPAPFVVWKSIRKEFAKKIDIYFSKFGYKVSKFKDIDIYTRPRYNFIKCADCHVHGDIPQDDLMTIKGIMESGITFWHDTRVGEYGDYKDNLAPVRNNPQYLKPSYMEV